MYAAEGPWLSKFNDSARLGDNLAVYAHELAELDATLGPILAARLDELVAGRRPGRAPRGLSQGAESIMSGWFLASREIEGVRGINNEGDPLVLSFAHDAVNSVSAPNGVGKSSIFDALTYALRKKIPKLDDLPATESALWIRPLSY
jgi:hypothetical protein